MFLPIFFRKTSLFQFTFPVIEFLHLRCNSTFPITDNDLSLSCLTAKMSSKLNYILVFPTDCDVKIADSIKCFNDLVQGNQTSEKNQGNLCEKCQLLNLRLFYHVCYIVKLYSNVVISG